MSNDWLWDGSGAPDAELRELEGTLSSLRYTGKAPQMPRRGRAWWPRLLAVAAVLVAVVGAAAWLSRSGAPPEGWAMTTANGCPDADCLLAVGEWLDTDALTWLEVADIGEMEIAPNSRLRLMQTGDDEHRLELAQGRISAVVVAPPRLLVVETPAATAVDLGCAYTLDVDEHGNGELQVSSGYVALEVPNRAVVVPAGAMASTRVGHGPGTPSFADAGHTYRVGLNTLDFGGEERTAALDVVLENSRVKDTLTLWHLLPTVLDVERVAVYDRLVALHSSLVDRQAVLNLDRVALEALGEELSTTWY